MSKNLRKIPVEALMGRFLSHRYNPVPEEKIIYGKGYSCAQAGSRHWGGGERTGGQVSINING